ncbi:uncharacterized protein HRG_02270 [Hirsutella rhossiliensis]|uniref:Bromo domain-containing protein n=1 Tax=Hirsutella rhossiliensis TaxID=111463 RepID=A0A9P8SN65_9HYPO|nr:uncharacterized protein HRG_02270 [Hirsutella rhossiliensis]KAH0966861.1 hypothetical protein HRG_02270 [Hirsutella rhossiliensis]
MKSPTTGTDGGCDISSRDWRATVAPIHLAKREGPLGRWRGGPWGMNNNNPAAYTPLESLFLFQSLLTHGVDTGAFARISELLKNNALIKGGDTYDPARLTPEALQHLFLLLLRQELKSEAERQETADGPSSPASRKRKLGTPPLPSLKDSHEHIERLPALIDRLYARYREHIVEQIRVDERQFVTIQSQIQVLEKNEKERLAKAASQNGTPALAPRDNKLPASSQTPSQSLLPPPTPGTAAGIKRGLTPNTPVQPTKPPTTPSVAQPTITPPIPLQAKTPPPPAGPPQAAPRVLQPPAQPPKPAISPRPEASSKPKDGVVATPLPTTPTGVLKWEKPYQPPQAGQTPQASQTSPAGQLHQNAPTQATAAPKGQQPQQRHPQQGKNPAPPPQTTGPLAAPSQPGPPQSASAPAPPSARPQSTTPVIPPGRPIQPQQAQHPTPRPIVSASPTPPKGAPGPVAAAQKWQQQPQPAAPKAQQRPSTNTFNALPASQKDKLLVPPYGAKPPRPAIPEHIIRQAAGTPVAKRLSPVAAPRTPGYTTPSALTRGFGTKWASHSTPSTPGPIVVEPESPAYEPVSPPPRATSITSETPKAGKKMHPKRTPQPEPSASRPRGRPPRNPPASATPSVSRRSQSEASQADELSMDYSSLSAKIKKEVMTPRPHDDAGETTTDESVHGRAHMVLWTRGFTKVSSSALDQISSHRHANMFATGVREKDAPGYRQIVLQPQDITSIRAAIKQGNKAAVQAASSLPGGDPGTASVWLPVSEDLVPPKGIVNSAQLERELVHIFCNAIMYNPDPDRGPGQFFMKRSQNEEEEVVGYHLDENGVVKNTRSMFVEVEKLLGDLRSAEKERGVPPLSSTRQASVATPADDTAEDEDELAGDGNHTATSVVKRRRIGTRG